MSPTDGRHFVDAHCHLADPRCEQSPGGVSGILDRSRGRGISSWVLGGVSPDDWERARKLRETHGPELILCAGLHPWWVIDASAQAAASARPVFNDAIERALERLTRVLPEAAGCGELGFDFFRDRSRVTESIQRYVFRRQLAAAQKAAKPLVLHVVRAHAEAIGELEAHASGVAAWARGPGQRGMVHSFSGTGADARRYLDLGLSLSISGAICKKGAIALREVVGQIPEDRLMIETDSPDQAPVGWTGARNEPASLWLTADVVGRCRGLSAEACLALSSENARRLFA